MTVGFPENVLAKGEKVERDLHPHWLTVVVPTILGLLLAAACIVIVMQTPDDETGNRIQWIAVAVLVLVAIPAVVVPTCGGARPTTSSPRTNRKSTRLNSSHDQI